MKFKDLRIGDTFDFINDNKSGYTRCEKIKPQTYKSLSSDLHYRVGSTNAHVYHVKSKRDKFTVVFRGPDNKGTFENIDKEDVDRMFPELNVRIFNTSNVDNITLTNFSEGRTTSITKWRSKK